MPPDASELDDLLKRIFGYGSFRPLQREICTTTLAGRDVFALLPTGGGKSLCFQLPALVRGVLGNVLVCLAVWLCYSARSTTDRILADPTLAAEVRALMDEIAAGAAKLLPVATISPPFCQATGTSSPRPANSTGGLGL